MIVLMLGIQLLVFGTVLSIEILMARLMFLAKLTMQAAVLSPGHRVLMCRFMLRLKVLVLGAMLGVQLFVFGLMLRMQTLVLSAMLLILVVGKPHRGEPEQSGHRNDQERALQ